MFRLLLFFILNLSSLALSSQPSTLKIVDRTPVDTDTFWGVDTYEHLYFSKNNVFYKTENQKKFQFQDLQLGDLESVDLLNPLKILLFYKDANTIVILDNRLNEIERVNFNFIPNFKTIDYAGISKDDLLWVFNAENQELELFDYKLIRTRRSSLPLNRKIIGFKSNYNFAWLQHSSGFLKYNINGSLVAQSNFENVLSYNLFKNQMMIETEEFFKLLDADFELKVVFKKPEIRVNQFYFNGENIYIYSDKVLYKYKYNIVNN